MASTLEHRTSVNIARLPLRLHHNAWVVEDQERTRQFYEDVLGFTLTAFWIETEEFQGDKLILSHAFYGLEDGSALAFFSLDDPAHKAKFKSPYTEIFNHLALAVDDATQADLRERIEAAGLFNFTIEHGYCRSLYVQDPDGLRIEFAVDALNVDDINAAQRRDAHAWLKRWSAGHRTSNNRLYTDGDPYAVQI